jgi:hypothetical protein
LAFHTLPISIVDPDFAKQQMQLMLRGAYLHPSGQIPAYEWNFSDVNPPVHAWATLFLYRIEQALRGEADSVVVGVRSATLKAVPQLAQLRYQRNEQRHHHKQQSSGYSD